MNKTIFNVAIDSDQKEFVERKAFSKHLSASALARKQILTTDWKRELRRLRKIQPETLARPGRKKVKCNPE